VSVTEPPSPAQIEAFYADYGLSYNGGGSSQGGNLDRYARRYLALVSRWRDGGRLVDVGSASNPFPNHAARAGYDTTVVDFTRPRGLQANVGFIAGHMNDEQVLVGRSAAFDIVTSWAVMEHVLDPPRSAAVLAGLCQPGGLIIVSTPEAGTLLTRHAIGHSPWFYPPEHLNLISPRALGWMFDAAGCRLLHWGRLELSWWRYAARYGLGLAGLACGVTARAASPQWWQAQRDRRVQRFQGVTYFVFEKDTASAGRSDGKCLAGCAPDS
jgi:hypothetical protein